MLQGTLDVFSLDEVLGLLSGANKTGVLNITGDRGVGSVSIADGLLVAASASSSPEVIGLSDVVFELLRYEEGSFSFDGAAAVEGDPHELDAVMSEAHLRLDEWKGISAVVPSLDHHLELATKLSTTQVTLSEPEWAAIVAVGEGASVGVVARRLGLGEFDGSKRVKSLIERSLATISEGTHGAHASPSVAAPSVDTPAPALTVPVFSTPEPAPASFAAAGRPMVDEPTLEEDDGPADSTVARDHDHDHDAVADLAADFSFPTVAPDAPAFEDPRTDAFVADEFVADHFGADQRAADQRAADHPAADEDEHEDETEIPPMPEAPSFSSFADVDTEIPPMPEPPSTFADEPAEVAPAPAAFSDEAIDAPVTSGFGGLDPVGAPGLFEPPRRSADRANAFGAEGFGSEEFTADAATEFEMAAESDASIPPPPAAGNAIPSFAPPSGFDAQAFDSDAFGVTEDQPVAVSADEPVAEPEKGGSLLMRYLKSNG